jgi:hypothetical protein
MARGGLGAAEREGVAFDRSVDASDFMVAIGANWLFVFS